MRKGLTGPGTVRAWSTRPAFRVLHRPAAGLPRRGPALNAFAITFEGPHPNKMITDQIRSTVYPSGSMSESGGLAPPCLLPRWLLSVLRPAGLVGSSGLA